MYTPPSVGKIDITCHSIGYNKKSTVSVIFEPKIYYRDLTMRKHRTIPNKEIFYKMTYNL